MNYRHQRSAPLIRVQDLVTIHYYEIDADYRFEGEEHPFWEIVYIDNGAIHARNGEEDWQASAGEILFHAPKTFHCAEGNGQDQGHIFIISFSSRSPAMEQFRDLRLQLPPQLRILISGIMREASACYDMETNGLSPLPNPLPGGDQMIRNYLEQLLIALYRELQQRSAAPVAQDLPSEIILYLNSRIYGTLSMAELCEQMHYGKTRLSHLFKQETGQSVMEYYRRLKISEAKRLLREESYTVAEISEMLCFDTPQYFSIAFKREAALTPGQYRRSVQPINP